MTEDTQSLLLQMEREWGDALLKGDVSFFEQIEAEDFTAHNRYGGFLRKNEDIADLKSGAVKVEQYVLRDMKVRLYDKAAVVIGRGTIKGRYKGAIKGKPSERDISGEFTFTDTFIYRDGRWQVVASQATPVAE